MASRCRIDPGVTSHHDFRRRGGGFDAAPLIVIALLHELSGDNLVGNKSTEGASACLRLGIL